MDALSAASGGGPARGTMFRFVNALLKASPGMSRKDAATAFRQATFWSNQGNIISQMDPTKPIDRDMAREVNVKASNWVTGDNYRYEVEISITFPGESKPQNFRRYIVSDRLLDLSEAYEQGYEDLYGDFKYSSAPLERGGGMAGVDASISLKSFVRFVMVQ